MGRTGGLERLAQAVRRPELGLVCAVDGVECGGAAEADDAVLLGPCAVRGLVNGLRCLLAQLLLQHACRRPICRQLPYYLRAWPCTDAPHLSVHLRLHILGLTSVHKLRLFAHAIVVTTAVQVFCMLQTTVHIFPIFDDPIPITSTGQIAVRRLRCHV